jgi:hypothetical protein
MVEYDYELEPELVQVFGREASLILSRKPELEQLRRIEDQRPVGSWMVSSCLKQVEWGRLILVLDARQVMFS